MAGILFADVAEHVLPYVHGDQVRARVREECPAGDMCRGTVSERKKVQGLRLRGTKFEKERLGVLRARGARADLAAPGVPNPTSASFRPFYSAPPRPRSAAAAMCAGELCAARHRCERRVRRRMAQVLP